MRRVAVFFISLVIILPLCVSCQPQKKTGAVLVKVGGESISEADLELLAKINPRLEKRLAMAAGKKQVLDNYVEQSLMYQEAKSQGLDSDPLVQAKTKLYKKVILAQSLLEARLNDATKAYYDENLDEFEKIKIAHIYIPFKTKEENRALTKDAKVTRSEKQAKDSIDKIREALKKDPAQFEKLAEQKSEDLRTNKRGGDLGWLTKNDARMKRWGWEKITETAFPLAHTAITDPIRTEHGFHLLKVLAEKKKDEYSQVEARIRFKIQAGIKAKLVEELKDKYGVTYAESQEEEAAPPAPAEGEG